MAWPSVPRAGAVTRVERQSDSAFVAPACQASPCNACLGDRRRLRRVVECGQAQGLGRAEYHEILRRVAVASLRVDGPRGTCPVDVGQPDVGQVALYRAAAAQQTEVARGHAGRLDVADDLPRRQLERNAVTGRCRQRLAAVRRVQLAEKLGLLAAEAVGLQRTSVRPPPLKSWPRSTQQVKKDMPFKRLQNWLAPLVCQLSSVTSTAAWPLGDPSICSSKITVVVASGSYRSEITTIVANSTDSR